MLSQLHNNKTIDLILDVKLIKNGKIYFSLNRIAESFLYNFGVVLFNSMFYRNLTCKDITGSTFTPRSANTGNIPFIFRYNEGNTYIVLSNSSTDQVLSFNDFKINIPLTNITVVSGYPQYNIDSGSNYLSLKIVDKWTYTGSDTSITASALYYKGVYDTSGTERQVMLAKDVFDPSIDLQNNSLIEWSYIIKISL
jgi:hypothetical protein